MLELGEARQIPILGLCLVRGQHRAEFISAAAVHFVLWREEMRVRFQEVKIKGKRRWKENGKWRQETKVFMQTLNPFNKNAAGEVKSLEEIQTELIAERKAWLTAAPTL